MWTYSTCIHSKRKCFNEENHFLARVEELPKVYHVWFDFRFK